MQCILLQLVVVLCLVASPVWAQMHGRVVDIQSTTKNLIRTIEDLGGQVANLAVEETETEVRIELSGDVLFGFDSADIRIEAEPVLTNVADVIKKYPAAGVLIEGYTDAKGADDYNLALSQQRADSVKNWLVAKGGVPAGSMNTRGLGEANPVAPNDNPDGGDNPEGRQKNRRVEITVKK